MRRLEYEDGAFPVALEGRGYTFAAWGGVLLILLWLALTIDAGQWSDAWLVSGFLALSIAYLTLVRQLPAVLDLVVVLTALLNVAGWGGGLLESVWFFDDVVHLLTPLTGAVLICLRLGQSVGAPLTERRALLWTLATALTLSAGVLWEFAEWIANSFRFPLEDTLPDLLLDTLGAMLGAALALWLMERYPPGTWRSRAAPGSWRRGPARPDERGQHVRALNPNIAPSLRPERHRPRALRAPDELPAPVHARVPTGVGERDEQEWAS